MTENISISEKLLRFNMLKHKRLHILAYKLILNAFLKMAKLLLFFVLLLSVAKYFDVYSFLIGIMQSAQGVYEAWISYFNEEVLEGLKME